MPLWGNRDLPSGNQKPVFANTTNASSSSTINGAKANTNKYYGNVYGVSAAEEGVSPQHGSHAGWVSQKIGTGPIAAVGILTRGTGINTAGFLLVTDGSPLGQGTGLNISYTIANTANLLEAYSTNPALNGINTVTIVNGGSGWSNTAAALLTVKVNQSNTTQPTFALVGGGRAGRLNYETIVAMGSITDDDPRDNVYFSGV